MHEKRKNRCPLCGSGNLSRKVLSKRFEVNGEVLPPVEIHADQCMDCGDWIIPLSEIRRAKAEAMERQKKRYSGKVDLQMDPEFDRALAKAARESGGSLNQFCCYLLKKAVEQEKRRARKRLGELWEKASSHFEACGISDEEAERVIEEAIRAVREKRKNK